MTSPLRKERELEKRKDNLPADTAEILTADTANEVDAARERPRLVRSGPTATEQAADATQAAEPANSDVRSDTNTETAEAPLFPVGELRELHRRWDQIQTSFVDQPRAAVHDAELLVSSAMKRLADVFGDERSRLEKQWNAGNNVSTEDLRMAFQRYRTFFRRVLSI